MAQGKQKKPRYQSTKRAEGKRRLAEKVRAYTSQGLSIRIIADRLGISERYVSLLRKLAEEGRVGEVRYHPAAKPLSQVPPEARVCLEDTPEGLERFVARYWPDEPLVPHLKGFVRAAYVYAGACSTCTEPAPFRLDEELLCDVHAHDGLDLRAGVELIGRWKLRVLINVPPDSGKSTTFSVRMRIWRICQSRDFRSLVISETAELAVQLCGEVAMELESHEQLVEDFGGFRSDAPEVLWQPGKGALRVEGSGIKRGYNLLARGMGQQIQGLRADEIVIDDPEAPSDVLTEERRRQNASFVDNIVIPRLDPGGRAYCIQTRQHLYDLSQHLSSKKSRTGEPVWQHINFPAVLDWGEKRVLWDCIQNGGHHGPNYPRCCRSFDYLMSEVFDDIGTYAFEQTYQQQPIPPERRLVQPDWIHGSDTDPDPNRGCLDRERSAGPIPLAEGYIRCLAYDPSGGSKYAAIVTADILASKAEFRAVILEIWRRKAGIRDAMLELERLASLYNPQFFIPEWNLIRAMEQNVDFEAWRGRHGIRLIRHETGTNKRDVLHGIDALGIDFEQGRIRLPYADVESRGQSSLLIREATEYPFGQTQDVLMATWFLKWNHRQLWLPTVRTELGPNWWRAPSHVETWFPRSEPPRTVRAGQ